VVQRDQRADVALAQAVEKSWPAWTGWPAPLGKMRGQATEKR
jgi:hypothetical protein